MTSNRSRVASPRVAAFIVLARLAAALHGSAATAGESIRPHSVFAKQNLVAWCIVPFDAKKRDPEERARMLARLDLKKVAYDWREEHVPTFEREILAYKKYGLEYFAFWSWHADIAPLIEKHGLRPQIWKTAPSPREGTREQRVEAAARILLPAVEQSRRLGCRFGLYNHGGWGGEPSNMVAVVRWLRENAGADHVGIVYNFHHGHGHIDDFAECLELMMPYLLCINLNGMNRKADPMIMPLGQGPCEEAMVKAIMTSDYRGPIGILGHTKNEDVEAVLRRNLDGLKRLLHKLGDKDALTTYSD